MAQRLTPANDPPLVTTDRPLSPRTLGRVKRALLALLLGLFGLVGFIAAEHVLVGLVLGALVIAVAIYVIILIHRATP